MALGAQRKNILWSFVGQGVRWTAIGGCIGVAAALTLVRFTRRILFEITGYDPKVLLAVAAIISAATLSACTIPSPHPFFDRILVKQMDDRNGIWSVRDHSDLVPEGGHWSSTYWGSALTKR